ncbi:MAG: TetR/AcrR family transcriptional regulator [Burkholderiales bacterium]
MPRGKAPTFELQRSSILQAAARLFAERGFASASMSELADACGISKPLLYHYYRDKEHLLFDIANGYMDRLINIVADVRACKLAPEQHLRALIGRFMQEYEHAQSHHIVLIQDVKFLGARERRRVLQKERRVVDAFTLAIAALKPRFRKKALRVPIAMILFGMINWTFTWLRADGPLTYGDMANVVAEIFLRGATGTPAAT